MHPNKTASFLLVLLVVLLDYIGFGLVYPMFSAMLFDPASPLVPEAMSEMGRGLWLGILVSLMPLAQFFTAPIWGALSDARGRKAPLSWSLAIGVFGYGLGATAVTVSSLILLAISRFVLGIAIGNLSIVQAAIADLSSSENKARNFSLLAMVMGGGYTLGPFFGGLLSTSSYVFPFLIAAMTVGLNWLLVVLYFKETHFLLFKRSVSWKTGFYNLQKALSYKHMRPILSASFLHNFAWTFYFAVIPVYLIHTFGFSGKQIGLYYGFSGCFYSLSAGILTRPLLKWLKPETLFFLGNLCAGLLIASFSIAPNVPVLMTLVGIHCYFVALITPSSTTIVSNSASAKIQGESLGVLGSVNAAGLILAPLVSGALVGINALLPMWISGFLMTISALIVALHYKFKNLT